MPDEKPTVRVRPYSYQPSKAELDEDVSVDATPEEVRGGPHAACESGTDRRRLSGIPPLNVTLAYNPLTKPCQPRYQLTRTAARTIN